MRNLREKLNAIAGSPKDFARLDKAYLRDGVRYLTGIDDGTARFFEILSGTASPEGLGWAAWSTGEDPC